MVDIIIVGQGIAGTMLSWFLLKAGKSIKVIDHYNPSSSSNIALGITKPITGRRLVKTWMAEELIGFSVKTYTEFEAQFNQKFLNHWRVYKIFDSIKAQNDWSVRASTAEYMPYLQNPNIVYLDKAKVKNDFGCFELSGSIQVDISALLSAYRKFLKEKGLLVEAQFQNDLLQITTDCIGYGDLKAEQIIFCEGAAAATSPYFKQLPFLLAKGEALRVRIKDFYADRIVNGNVLIMPTVNKDEYYVGATHHWDFVDDKPSEKGKQELLNELETILNVPYEIIDHKAAIRPTVQNRRPFIGFHPQHNQVGIFNGLGTKGVSLAPYFANHFVKHITEGAPLLDEVDIKRFYS